MAKPARPRGLHPMGALRVSDPQEWERRIREAMDAADGDVEEAAKIIGVSRRHLYRWLETYPEHFSGVTRKR